MIVRNKLCILRIISVLQNEAAPKYLKFVLYTDWLSFRKSKITVSMFIRSVVVRRSIENFPFVLLLNSNKRNQPRLDIRRFLKFILPENRLVLEPRISQAFVFFCVTRTKLLVQFIYRLIL